MVTGENKQIVAVEPISAAATSAADEPRALCIIRDLSSGMMSSQKQVANLPASSTAGQLMHDVAMRFQYLPDSFLLLMQTSQDDNALAIDQQQTDTTLQEMGFSFDNTRNNLIICDKGNIPPRKLTDNLIRALNNKVTTWQNDPLDVEVYVPYRLYNRPAQFYDRPAPPPYTPPDNLASGAQCSNSSSYIGLVNQAMTCYLNSVLQTLYMTPEFRNALYRWEFDGTEEEGTRSIPFQLQKLFLQLQTSTRPAVGTTELTTSFGWDKNEAWQQHDVQELCRVMFDALEQKFKNTEQADLISTLYEGKLKDYVKCLECGYENAREDTFLDVPLVVRPFGSNQAYSSVAEALEAFVTPETLQGSNQYQCSGCNRKCDAHKGFKFVRFPYLLTLQLKRFDFDPHTMHRIKLNDRVSFPEILSLNGFVKTEAAASESDAVPDQGSDPTSEAEEDAGICLDDEELNKKNIQKSLETGPFVYELFSIMVHSGNANGGHYYSYIKSLQEGEWYCFNDAQVRKVTQEDIQKTYGGGPVRGYYSSTYSGSTNAYMLMYRQIDKQRNTDFMKLEELPEHIQALLQCMQEQEEKERQQKEIERSMCKIMLFCQHPVQGRMVDMKLKIHKDTTLNEATRTAHTILNLDVPLECCRLVKYDDFHDSLESSFEGAGNQPMGELLGGVRSSYKFDLLLEIRKPEEQFSEYKPGGTTLKVHVIDLDKEEITSVPVTIRSHPTNTVEELKDQIAQALCLSSSEMRIVLEVYNNEFKFLSLPNRTLVVEGFRKSNKVFIEFSDKSDAEKPYPESKLFRILDCYYHTICIHISLPNVDKANIDSLRLYDYICEDFKDPGVGSVVANEGFDFLPNTSFKLTSGCRTNSSSLEAEVGDCPPHSDQSEDSSLTDSERTLVGDSPRNNSPDPLEMDLNLTYSSEVSQLDCDSGLGSTEIHNMSSPEENIESACVVSCHGDSPTPKRYFRAYPYNDYETSEKMLRTYVDKRITLSELKKELEKFIGLKADCFKVYRVYSNNQEFECTRLSDNLMSYTDDNRLTIKLGRALRKGEYKVKIYQLTLNEPEPFKFLMDWILVSGMTVLQAKKEILPHLKDKFELEIPLNRCRLRKKSWKNPGSVYFDHQQFEKDIPVNTNWELFLQVLPDAEPVISSDQFLLLARRWHPSTYTLDPFTEFVVDDLQFQSIDSVVKKLSEIVEIPVEFVEIAKGQGTFPYEVSVLSVHKELEWVSLSSENKIYITEDGCLVFYRDTREELKNLTEDEKRELMNKENAKSNKNVKCYYSPRKEKALKIYTDDSNVSNSSQSTQKSTSSQSAQPIVPDLD